MVLIKKKKKTINNYHTKNVKCVNGRYILHWKITHNIPLKKWFIIFSLLYFLNQLSLLPLFRLKTKGTHFLFILAYIFLILLKN